ncbi:MAG: 4-(cytidine 5'-diphospho)-2-C-methyl-D-erythritol kinase [Balneolales bacterium]
MEQNTRNITWISRSFAKINLGLQVLERLPNGYHEIATGYCFINWNDRFELKSSPDFHLVMSDDRIPVSQNNLIVRALETLRRYVTFNDNFSVSVEKLIPFSAGLGGGSSNAATIIRMVNKVTGLDLPTDDLVQFLSGLGADIPVFLHGKPGIGSGIGSDITFYDIQPDAWIVTAFPSIHISTADAYKHCIPNRSPDIPIDKILMNEPLEEWRYMLVNDLEPWVIHQHPIIGDLKDQFYELGAVYSAMSGSGSSVFGLFQQEFVAVDAYHRLIDWKMQANITPASFEPDFGVYRNS